MIIMNSKRLEISSDIPPSQSDEKKIKFQFELTPARPTSPSFMPIGFKDEVYFPRYPEVTVSQKMPTTNYYMNSGKNRSLSPSKRWQTTTGSALEEVASQLAGNYDRAAMVKDLKDRKTANTKTSISFGNEKVNYLSDTIESQLKGSGFVSLEERTKQLERIKAMKAELTTTNFRLGDEKPEYESVNHQTMAIAETFRGQSARPSSNNQLKEAIKRSSIHFGNEKVQYETVAHEAMKYRGNENNFSKLKEEVQTMTATLRRHNFSFGDEKVSYMSDSHAGYGSVPLDAYKQALNKKGDMKETIDEQRRCHFSLGNDRPHYLSNTHSALKIVEGHSANNVFDEMQRAKQMKQALQKTSIVIGDDEEYF